MAWLIKTLGQEPRSASRPELICDRVMFSGRVTPATVDLWFGPRGQLTTNQPEVYLVHFWGRQLLLLKGGVPEGGGHNCAPVWPRWSRTEPWRRRFNIGSSPATLQRHSNEVGNNSMSSSASVHGKCGDKPPE